MPDEAYKDRNFEWDYAETKAIRPLRHDDPDEHFHDDDEGGCNEHPSQIRQTEDVLGLEAFTQNSVGIDIGSSTSHLIFSELMLRREGFSSRFRVTERTGHVPVAASCSRPTSPAR